MILTVTPNICVDKTFRIEDFQLNRVNRPSLAHTVAGGKGINVARVYQTLGGKAVVTGMLGGANGRIVASSLAREGIESTCMRMRGECRLCIAVIDPTTGTQTEINEPGPTVSARTIRELCRRVERLLQERHFNVLVLSGSLPPGAPIDTYARLIEAAHREGIPSVLDSSGEPLRIGAEARPWLIKPNRFELESLLQRKIEDEAGLTDAAREVYARGIPMVAASMGEAGALLVTQQGSWRAFAPKIDFVSAVASGDSFLAAFLWSWSHGDAPGRPEEALRLAVGAGAANAAVIGAGFCSRDSVHELACRVNVRPLQD